MARTPTPTRVLPIVVAYQDTPAAGGVIEAARSVASRLSAPLLPARVAWRPDTMDPAGAPRARPPVEGRDAHPLLEGVPAIEIVRYAELKRAGLLILGDGQEDEGAGDTLKELADAVVRRADVPCLILPTGQDRLARTLVALDGSERGMRALRVAWGMRAIQDGELTAMYVSTEREQRAGVVGPPGARAQEIGARVTETLGPGSGVAVLHRRGDVVDEVLRGLSAEAGDLLVVGVRRGGPADPSESTGEGRRLLAAARCAVLTVPL